MKLTPQFLPCDPGKINCYNCHAENVSGCPNCHRCEACGCLCQRCRDCSKIDQVIRHPRGYFCRDCGRCKKFDRCRRAPKALHVLENIPHNHRKNELTRSLGLEIELYPVGKFKNLRLPDFLRYELVRDGSLTVGGQELVVWPLAGDQFLEAITSLAEGLASNGSGVDEKCGFHVHVGAKDLNAFALRRALTLYTQLEPEIFKVFTTPERILSRFCKPYDFSREWMESLWNYKDSSQIKAFLIPWLYRETIQPRFNSSGEQIGFRNLSDLRRHKYEPCRYHGLNFHSWFERNTLEFRQHQGTIELERLIYWPLFCGWLIELSNSLQDREILQIQTLSQLLNGSWKRPFKHLQIPTYLVKWVEAL